MTDRERQARDALVATWERLGRPWCPDPKGSAIGDLPRWLDRHPAREWGGVEWALSIWKVQAAKGRPTERYWARTFALVDEPDEVASDGD